MGRGERRFWVVKIYQLLQYTQNRIPISLCAYTYMWSQCVTETFETSGQISPPRLRTAKGQQGRAAGIDLGTLIGMVVGSMGGVRRARKPSVGGERSGGEGDTR
jgi:hypothetical protein